VNAHAHSKVQSHHLLRRAYLYVRQSSLTQVLHNTESTQRQYALKERAFALGWTIEQLVTIDDDLGKSGASAEQRAGFQTLITEVSMGRAGIVMGLEVSRLARNHADWHRLLEICALAGTLILDEDGVYDPAHFNDRLLLGLKGAMSEAELHLLRTRLIGGILSKARRGELRHALPVGLVYDAADRVALEPDAQVRQTLALFFETFQQTGSATATVKHFRAQRLCFPRRCRSGVHKGEILWGELTHHRALWVLHNPRYAGAFCYGRSRQRQQGSQRYQRLPREEWIALIPDAHPGYITWEAFERNEQRLRENAAVRGSDRRRSAPREGPALLQGLAICGHCGRRMTVRYSTRNGQLHPEYVCQREGNERGEPVCQHIAGPVCQPICRL
jgi:DNA invertase Pin-like site-specific DNA recombinase